MHLCLPSHDLRVVILLFTDVESIGELRDENKHLLSENEALTEELDLLTVKFNKQIVMIEKGG